MLFPVSRFTSTIRLRKGTVIQFAEGQRMIKLPLFAQSLLSKGDNVLISHSPLFTV